MAIYILIYTIYGNIHPNIYYIWQYIPIYHSMISKHVTYSLFTFSWPRFERGSLRNGGMLILHIYFAVDGMPIEMYWESWITSLLTSDDVMLYMTGLENDTRNITILTAYSWHELYGSY